MTLEALKVVCKESNPGQRTSSGRLVKKRICYREDI